MDINITPLLAQLTRNEGATIALAKLTLTEDKYAVFLIEQDIQALYSWLYVHATFKNLFSGIENFEDDTNKRIEILKKKRDDLIASQN